MLKHLAALNANHFLRVIMSENDYSNLPLTRKEAKLTANLYYFTGKPCKHGHVSPRRSSGVCVDCNAIQCKKWREENKIRSRENGRLAYAKNVEKMRSRKRAQMQKTRENFPEKSKEANRRWYQSHKQEAAENSRNKKALKRKAEGKHFQRDIIKLLEAQKGKCINCLKSIIGKFHVDHIIPLAKGGSNWPSNLQLLCPKCNCSKKDTMPLEWAKKNGRLV